jgi:hypothetical protein
MPNPVPSSIEQLGDRPFSFYPAILGVEHNEWTYSRGTWSETLVVNRTTGNELWIPRRYVGEVSRIDEPVVIVGLTRELEYRSGMVVPHERRVVEMPRAVNDIPRRSDAPPAPRPQPVATMRLAGGAESRVGRLLLMVVAIGIVACIAVIAFLSAGKRISYQTIMQSDLAFTATDDAEYIISKLGTPAEDKWRSEQGELQYRKLKYPKQGISIILMGTDRKTARYMGAMDEDWHVVHSINSDAETMLRTLKRF